MMRPDARSQPISEGGSPTKIRDLYLGGSVPEEEEMLASQGNFCCPTDQVPQRRCSAVASICFSLVAVFLVGGASASALLYWQFAPDVQEQMRLRSVYHPDAISSSWEHDVKYCRTLLARDAVKQAAKGGRGHSATATFTVEEVRTLEAALSKSDSSQGRLKEVEGELAVTQAENAVLKKDNAELVHRDALISTDPIKQLLNEQAVAVNKSARLEKILGSVSQSVTSHLGCFREAQSGWPAPLSGHRDYTNGAALGISASTTLQQCITNCAERPQCQAAMWNPEAGAECVFQTAPSSGPLREDHRGPLAGAFTFAKTGDCLRQPALAPDARGSGNGTKSSKRYAYVMMAYDDPETSKPGDSLFPVLAMARALQRLSRYPLVLLTNTTHFQDGTAVADSMRALGVEVLPVQMVPPPNGRAFDFRSWNVAWWKLQIWNLTQFDKLIWMDSDAILSRSMDWLFERQGMWAQRDDWFCQLNQPSVCSGIVLLEPNRSDFVGIQKFADSGANTLKGDQGVIEAYFRDAKKRPIHMMSDMEASFGQCIGKAASPFIDTDGQPFRGSWNLPAFVHKSGGWGNTNNNVYINVCFSHKIARQYYTIGNETVNVCHYHPLGPYWRNLFCEAVASAGLTDPEVNAFCNDDCWYRGIELPHLNATEKYGLDATKKLWCTPVDTSERMQDYYDRVAGEPLRELFLKNPRKLPSKFLK
mmetsp:Transcript_42389/g.112174  ORF Transcript_42389/g.112174 Transcript_42389/m.112174 type:complete len:704 (+) Transcript_42389:61-2172(+)